MNQLDIFRIFIKIVLFFIFILSLQIIQMVAMEKLFNMI